MGICRDTFKKDAKRMREIFKNQITYILLYIILTIFNYQHLCAFNGINYSSNQGLYNIFIIYAYMCVCAMYMSRST